MPSKVRALVSFSIALLFAGTALPAQARAPHSGTGISPALCGAGDIREPGIQGWVPAGQKAHYNCGVKLVSQLPLGGNVQGIGKCAYVRSRGQGGGDRIFVVDVSDPAKPVVVGKPLRTHIHSESLRVRVTKDRAIMVSGASVFDVSDCLHPKLLGEIKWPKLTVPGIPSNILLPHDIRINHTGTKVYASFGVWVADITNLHDPNSWKVTDDRCVVAAQIPGPWQDVQREAIEAGHSLCADAAKPAPQGANYQEGSSPLMASLLWPQVSHSPALNAEDTLLYVGDQAGGNSALWAPVPKIRIIDITRSPMKIIGEFTGAGHGLDWFRSGGRDYLLHSNEVGILEGTSGVGDTCAPYPRPQSLGWAYEAYITDVTDPAKARDVSMLKIAINEPRFCKLRKASGYHPSIAYHLIDNIINPKFAMVNFGDAGYRFFDIRDPEHPTEVAYFNHGRPTHAGVGYYDAKRGLVYAASPNTFWVLQIEPQVRRRLGL